MTPPLNAPTKPRPFSQRELRSHNAQGVGQQGNRPHRKSTRLPPSSANGASSARPFQTGAYVLDIFKILLNLRADEKRLEFCQSVEKLVPLEYLSRIPHRLGNEFFGLADRALLYIHDICPPALRHGPLEAPQGWPKACWKIASLIPATFFPENGEKCERFSEGVTAYLQDSFTRAQGNANNSPSNQHRRFLRPTSHSAQPSSHDAASVSAPPYGVSQINSNSTIKIEPPNREEHIQPSSTSSVSLDKPTSTSYTQCQNTFGGL